MNLYRLNSKLILLTRGINKRPKSITFHPMVRIVARIRLAFCGHFFISSNQFASNLSVNGVDSRKVGTS